MSAYILGFSAVDKTKLAIAGGKGANLGELCNINGILVPGGFCITTEAFKKVKAGAPAINQLVSQLSLLTLEERHTISGLCSKIRKAIEEAAIPADIVQEIARYITALGEKSAYAVRSSATAEDLPTASFAGQQDTYLNVIGKQAILQHISKCWASLYTDRAVMYRIQNGFHHHKVYLSVVVQKMVFPQVSGILFTADPVNGNRKVLSIDASFGLGEALVSGIVNADVYKVRNGTIVDKKIPAKKLAIYALENGGTRQQAVELTQQSARALTDEQILQLEHIGRKIQAHFGSPQDLNGAWLMVHFTWCKAAPLQPYTPYPK